MNCLRCGREIEEKQSFCEECSKTVSEPLVESAYLSSRVVLPRRKPQPAKTVPTKSGKRAERHGERQKDSQPRHATGFFATLCFFLAGCLVLLSLFFMDTWKENETLQQEKAKLTAENDRLTSRLDLANMVLVLADPEEPRRYHTFTCTEAGKNCTAKRESAALREGYIPCPVCQSKEDTTNEK